MIPMNEFSSHEPNSQREPKHSPYLIDKAFRDMVSGLEMDDPTALNAITDGWDIGPQQTNPEIMRTELPLGHIAFMGDFDQQQS